MERCNASASVGVLDIILGQVGGDFQETTEMIFTSDIGRNADRQLHSPSLPIEAKYLAHQHPPNLSGRYVLTGRKRGQIRQYQKPPDLAVESDDNAYGSVSLA